ncbi:MAG: serine/threonine protein kinase [Gemmatimonadaceae bacterium]
MSTFEQQLKDSLSDAYEIERELGGGGMSRVFVATERSLNRKVVIKVLSPELTAEVNRGRFHREIQVAAQLQHPHIVPLLSAGEDGGLVYYTMPFIKGESLKSALDKNGPLPIADVLRVLYDVVDAIAYAHGQGVVHRDIKPANILRSGSHALVTDFGVAKALNAAMPTSAMTSTGMAIGTPAYMAPEQLAGDPSADHRIDIYAVGLLAYELLSAKSPFDAPSPQGVLAAVLTRDPRPLVEVRPDAPRRLSEMVMSCLSKVPGGRPPTADALLVALDRFSTSSGEIRTREHKVQVIGPTVPVAIPAGELPVSRTVPAVTAASQTAPDGAGAVEPARPQKSGRKLLVGGVALVVPVIAAAILLSQRAGESASADTALMVSADSIGDSALVQMPPPAALTESAVVGARVDSQAIADSAKKRAARAEAAKRAAAARADSQRQQGEPGRVKARRAAAVMFADASGRRMFMRGATHSGGFLGAQRRGDLQTQIDALTPFLTSAGLTYEQFKRIVEGSGIQIYDEFGRMLPAALEQFAAGVD